MHSAMRFSLFLSEMIDLLLDDLRKRNEEAHQNFGGPLTT